MGVRRAPPPVHLALSPRSSTMAKSALDDNLLPTGHTKRESKLLRTRSPLIIFQSVLLFAIALRCFWSFSGLFSSNRISEDDISAVKWWKCKGEGDDPRTECGYLMYVVWIRGRSFAC